MINDYFSNIVRVEIYALIAFLIFFIFFVVVTIHALRMNKTEVEKLSAIPLEGNQEENQ